MIFAILWVQGLSVDRLAKPGSCSTGWISFGDFSFDFYSGRPDKLAPLENFCNTRVRCLGGILIPGGCFRLMPLL